MTALPVRLPLTDGSGNRRERLLKTTTRQSLEYFYQVAELGSIRAASDQLRIAASAVSRKVSQLEQEFGVELIVRQPRGVRLTEAGEHVYGYLKESRVRDALLHETIADLRGLKMGNVVVATGSGFVDGLVSPTLVEFMSLHPGIAVEILTVPADEILEAVLDDDAELGIVFGAPNETCIEIVRQSEHPVRLLVAPSHELARRSVVTLSDVAAVPLALPPVTAGIRQAVDRAFRDAGLKLSPVLTVGPIQGSIRFAAAGAGATFLPVFSCEAELDRGELVVIELGDVPIPTTTASLIVRRDRHLSPAGVALKRHLEFSFPLGDHGSALGQDDPTSRASHPLGGST